MTETPTETDKIETVKPFLMIDTITALPVYQLKEHVREFEGDLAEANRFVPRPWQVTGAAKHRARITLTLQLLREQLEKRSVTAEALARQTVESYRRDSRIKLKNVVEERAPAKAD